MNINEWYSIVGYEMKIDLHGNTSIKRTIYRASFLRLITKAMVDYLDSNEIE